MAHIPPPPPGIRAAALARPFLSELGLVALPSSLTLPAVHSCGLAEDGHTDNERVSGNADKCCRSVRRCGGRDMSSSHFICRELLWYIEALKGMKDKSGGYPN